MTVAESAHGRTEVKHTRRKKSSGLATRRIVYRNRKHPHARAQELTVDIRQGEHLDTEYAAAMVAVRTG
ncbi:MAG TPA: hypothetical protein VHH34_07025, partial [Pseudonocardiaceae bacterium]|nr:hypothetical protein [Pseudonocardiaceae bacterium]